MNKILIIVGSFRKDSYNHQLGDVIKKYLEKDCEVSFLDYQDLKFFNQDEEFISTTAIDRIRKEVTESDGLWFITPEYNGSYPAIIKNLIDWLSRPIVLNQYENGTAIMDKRVTYSSVAGKSKGMGVRDKLHELLMFVGADILNAPSVGIALTREDFANPILNISENDKALISKQAEAFITFIKKESND